MTPILALLTLLAPFVPRIENADFHAVAPGGGAVAWSPIGACRVLPGAGRGGASALELRSDGTADRGALQVIRVDPPAAGPFVISGWMRCEGVSEGGDCCLWLDVLQQDGPPIWGATGQPERGRPGWQRVRAEVHPSKPVREVQLFLLLRRARGRVLFSELRAEPILPAIRSVRAWRASAGTVQYAARFSAATAWRVEVAQPGRPPVRAEGDGDRAAGELLLAAPGPAWLTVIAPAAAGPPVGLPVPATGEAARCDAWSAGPAERIFEDDLPPSPAPHAAAIEMARGERESLQVCVRARAPGLRDAFARVRLIAPAGLTADVRREGYVWIATPFQHPCADRRGPAWWPEVLLPPTPRHAPPGVTRAFWITVHAPPGAGPGLRRGVVEVCDAAGVAARIPFTVIVHRAVLPARPRMKTAFAMMDGHLRKLYGGISPALRRACTDLLLDYRLNPDDISRTAPPDLDEIQYAVRRGLNAFNLLNVVPEPKGQSLWVCYADLPEYTPEFRRRFFERLDAIVPEVRRRGLLPFAYVYGFDERGPEFIPIIRDLFGEVHRRYPGLSTLSTCWPPLGTDPLSLSVDWFVPLSSGYDHPAALAVRRRGGEVWWYVCMGPNHPYANWLMENPLIEGRVIWWQAAMHGVEGMLYWGVNIWEREHNDRTIADDADPHLAWSITTGGAYGWLNGDGVLVYPGTQGPLAGLRLAAIRDGIEDTELLRLYAGRFGHSAARAAMTAVSADRTHFTRDAALLERVRRSMLRRLDQPCAGPAGPSRPSRREPTGGSGRPGRSTRR